MHLFFHILEDFALVAFFVTAFRLIHRGVEQKRWFWLGSICFLGWCIVLPFVPDHRFSWIDVIDAPLNFGWACFWAWPFIKREHAYARAEWQRIRANVRLMRQALREARAGRQS